MNSTLKKINKRTREIEKLTKEFEETFKKLNQIKQSELRLLRNLVKLRNRGNEKGLLNASTLKKIDATICAR